jgi:2-phospho-L-lactate guanylyltransferase
MELGCAERRQVVVAMLEDTVAAVSETGSVERIIVVCDTTHDVAEFSHLGVITHLNRMGKGLNVAVEAGAALAREVQPRCNLVVLPGDLPGLQPIDLSRALDLALRNPRSFVTDASGSGTTLLAATAGHELRAAYGESSSALHALSGAMEIVSGSQLGSLRHDVDDLADLRTAVADGRGPRTRQAYAELRGIPMP